MENKLDFLIKKIATQFELIESNSENIEIITKNLLLRNKEYQRKPKLRDDIAKSFSKYLENKDKEVPTLKKRKVELKPETANRKITTNKHEVAHRVI